MSRRERFTRQTDDELRRLEEAHIAKQKLLESRKGLFAKTLRTQRKDSLVQILTKLCDENIAILLSTTSHRVRVPYAYAS